MTLMYIHGYGSTGAALKGQQLREMVPGHRVVSPTFDYDHTSPWQIQEQIREVVENEKVQMIVGSSFGGYHSLCATTFFHGPVLAVNPVHNVLDTIQRLLSQVDGDSMPGDWDTLPDTYDHFDRSVFQRQHLLNQSGDWPDDTPLYFALSTDDELLGDHHALLNLFPKHRQAFWKDNCGHRFVRFHELKEEIAAIAGQPA